MGLFKKRVTPEIAAQMIAAYRSGLSAGKVAKMFGFTPRTVFNVLIRAGEPTRDLSEAQAKVTPETAKAMVEAYKSGLSAEKVAKQFGYTDDTVYAALKKAGEPSRTLSEAGRDYYHNEAFFDLPITSEYVAYVLGFVTADGGINVLQKRYYYLVIDLHPDDENILYKIKAVMPAENPINYYQGKDGHPYARLSILSKRLCESLITLGVTPRKSKTIEPCPLVPTHLLRHYYRGLVDGDGYVSYSKSRKTWGVGLKGTQAIVQGFKDFLMANSIETDSKVRKVPGCYNIHLGGNIQAAKICALLYSDANIYLDRKAYKAALCINRQVPPPDLSD